MLLFTKIFSWLAKNKAGAGTELKDDPRGFFRIM
jgi:hypothetical protein